MKKSRVTGTGRCHPKKLLTNKDLEAMVDTSDEWIRTRTGIEQRYIIEEGETCVSLSLEASKQALDAAGKKASDIDMIIVASLTPNRVMPSAACELGHGLGIDNVPAFDITAACSGFIYALSIADQFIRTGHKKTILCVGAEILSKYVNWKDRSTCVLFGDGAGAAIVETASEGSDSRILSTHMYCESSQGDILCIPSSGSKITPNDPEFEPDLATIQMAGRELFKYAVNGMVQAGVDALEANGKTTDDVDLLIPHQANIRIIDAVLKRLKFPKDKTMINVQKYGNTSAATIPMALDEAVREGRCLEGDLVLLASFGGGLTYGSCLLQL